jgi:hypothetical protein
LVTKTSKHGPLREGYSSNPYHWLTEDIQQVQGYKINHTSCAKEL